MLDMLRANHVSSFDFVNTSVGCADADDSDEIESSPTRSLGGTLSPEVDENGFVGTPKVDDVLPRMELFVEAAANELVKVVNNGALEALYEVSVRVESYAAKQCTGEEFFCFDRPRNPLRFDM